MAVQIKNSLSTFLEQSLVLEQNSLETVSKISEALTSQDESVSLTLTDPNDPENTKTYQIPSFGYLRRSIERIDNTLKSLTNVSGTTNSRVRLSDGTYRKIITSSIPSEAPTITQVDKVTNFNFKSNWFFEDMLNPCLYVNVNLTDQIKSTTERVLVRRYILTCDTKKKQQVFDAKLKNQNTIDYDTFVSAIVKNEIRYILDEDVRNLPPREKKYSGTFKVIGVSLPSTDYNGLVTKTYTLSSLEYTDNSTLLKNTRVLTAGDFVEVDTYPSTTRYKVTYVDTGTLQVRLQLVEGGQGLRIGTTLKISSEQGTETTIEVPVGYDEREVIFIKPIDPDSNIPADEWSPGIGFYTNELTYVDKSGNMQTLQRFYQQYVVDFGQVILSYAKDYYPSLREGLKPDAPILKKSNFKMVRINDQLNEYVDNDQFRSLIADKEQASSEIYDLTNQISEQRKYIQTTNFVTSGDKDKAYNDLQNLINKQNNTVRNYNSLVSTIKSRTTDLGYQTTPKYRIRGFWEIPIGKVSPSSGVQKVIKFVVRYRYLSRNGNVVAEEKIPMTTTKNTTITGVFSNWNEIHTRTRDRIATAQNDFVWEEVDIADTEKIKPNQCDIPINMGEQVEIQVRSISEAGWPSNPLMSDWSDSVVIDSADFPELQSDKIDEIIAQNRVDAAVANLGLYGNSYTEHMSTSFYTGDKYFAHTAESITSGFLTEEQTPITLYDKLRDLDRQLTIALEKINNVTGNIIVSLIDEDNKVYTLDEGSTTYVYAGDYVSEVNELTDSEKNGAIITKTFNIDIKCDTESGLYLLSKIAGDRMSMCPDSRNYVYIPDMSDQNTFKKLGSLRYVGFEYTLKNKIESSIQKVLAEVSTSTDVYNYGTLTDGETEEFKEIATIFTTPQGLFPIFEDYKTAVFEVNKSSQFIIDNESIPNLLFFLPRSVIPEQKTFKNGEYEVDGWGINTTAYITIDEKGNIGGAKLNKDGSFRALRYSEMWVGIFYGSSSYVVGDFDSETEEQNDPGTPVVLSSNPKQRIAPGRSPWDDIITGMTENTFGNDHMGNQFGVLQQASQIVNGVINGHFSGKNSGSDSKEDDNNNSKPSGNGSSGYASGTKESDSTDYSGMVNGENSGTDKKGGLSSIFDGTKATGDVRFEFINSIISNEGSASKPVKKVPLDVYEIINRYELYDNVVTPTNINSDYYMKYGRYDLVPINLSNSTYIDYQIASPNMYQSAQCCNQFIYSRFSNISGTMNLYANGVDSNGYGSYDDLYPFAISEKVYGTTKDSPIWSVVYPKDGFLSEASRKSYIIGDFEKTIGEPIVKSISTAQLFKNISLVMNRLPMTFPSSIKSSVVIGNTKQMVTRLSSYNSVSSNLRYANLLSQRLQSNVQSVNTAYSIRPKIQTAYGFGNVKDGLSRLSSSGTLNKSQENIYLSTHKIGYEPKDRFAVGSGTCDSFLFLSPNNHQSIQVSGDNQASEWINRETSITVPLVYQYRMTDYKGNIFGSTNKLQEYDSVVKNTKYANIIGIDIWSDILSEKPKQFDIVVYSTYSGQQNTDTGKVKTSTQVVHDGLAKIVTGSTVRQQTAQQLTSPVSKMI